MIRGFFIRESHIQYIIITANYKKNQPRHLTGLRIIYLPGLKESFRLTERLNTRWPGVQSLESGQK